MFMDADGNSVSNGFTVTVVNGKTVISFSLEAGEKVYITNLPTDSHYSVAEAVGNYTAAYTNETGDIAANTIKAVTVTNSPRTNGSLVITKEVLHPFEGNLSNVFDFTVVITGITATEAQNLGLPTGASYTYDADKNEATVTGIQVADDYSVTISNIPAGATYKVTELAEKGFTLNTTATKGATGTIFADTVSTAAFVNDYTPDPPAQANITVNVLKTLDAAAPLAEEVTFNFAVQKYENGAYVTVKKASVTMEGKSTYDRQLDSAILDVQEFKNVGTYYYRIVELIPEEDLTDEKKIPGMTYDRTECLFKVVVTDPGEIDGTLEVSVESVSGCKVSASGTSYTVSADFINTYRVNGTTVVFNIFKELENSTGVDVPLNIFEFVLKDSSGNPYGNTVKTDVEGKASISVPIDAVGTVEYYLTEVAGSITGMTYDNAEYKFVVTTVNNDSQLESTVKLYKYDTTTQTYVSVTGTTATFTNEYKLGSVTVPVSGNKTLEGKTFNAGDFSFTIQLADDYYKPITGENAYSETVTVNADGTFSFTALKYSAVGTYRYTVTELIPEDAVNNRYKGITYDTSEYHVTVVVSLDSAGKLAADVQVTKVGVGEVEDKAISFTNTYSVTGTETLALKGKKTLEGRPLYGSEFTFIAEVYKVVNEKDVYVTSTTATNLSTGDIMFPEFTYTASDIGTVYKYVISEQIPEAAGNTNQYQGVTYDTSKHVITVTVLDNGEGGIKLAVVGNDTDFSFTNKYSAAEVSVSLSGKKTLNGRDMIKGEFEFVLKNEKGEEIETVYNAADGTFNFKDIEYTSAGTYIYTVSETDGGKGGVTYDETVYTVTVTVTDDGKGILSTSTVISGLGSLSFTNNYKTENAVIEITGEKELTGKDLSEGDFTFGIFRANVTDGVFTTVGDAVLTVKNDAEGKFAFTNGVFTAPGTYYYVVKEIDEGVTGITYDKTEYNITVVVTDNGVGNLEAEVTVEGNKAIEFTNSYAPLKTSVTFKGEKKYDKSLNGGEFKFVLKDENGEELETVTNKAGGAFEFTAIEYTVACERKYTISEVDEGKGGVNYDKTVYEISVTVADGGEGRLVATVTGGTSFTFTNTYSTDSIDFAITGEKELIGRTIKDGDFKFVLKNSAGEEVETVSNIGNTFTFSKITYYTADTYTYTVSEVKEGKGGITYDNTVYTVKVIVTDNGDGTLSASQTVVNASALKFVNSYSVTESAKVNLSGIKKLEGRALKAGEFTFVLKDSEGKELQRVTNAEDGSFKFETLTYSVAGVHNYTVSELNDGKGGVSYDDTVYEITVTVTDGGAGAYVATTKIKNNPEIVFTNSYSTGPVSVPLSGKKTLNGRNLVAGEFEFGLYSADGLLLQKASNNANGEFKFDNLTFTKAGNYTFIVTEIQGTKGGISYDNRAYTVKIDVTDNGDGTLSYSTWISGGTLAFVNTYTATSVSETVSGVKVLNGRELQEGEFEFALKDADGNVIETVKNGADGTFVFSELTFTSAGVYQYTVNEVKGDNAAIKYDGQKFFVIITVTDNGAGQLVAKTSITGGGIKFTNTYTAAETSVVLNGEKTLEGKTLEDGQFSFVLKDENGVVVETVKNGADGSFAFSPITFKAAGEYVFTVSELNDNQSGINYDTTVYTVTVKVTDDTKGALNAEVSIADGEKLAFANGYSVSPVSVSLSASKTLEGRELERGEFVFYLKDAEGKVLQTVTNSADGSIAFTDLTFNAAGEYVYTVNERQGNVNAMVYDSTVFTVIIVVTDNGDGTLSAVKTVDGGDMIFKNIYDPEDAQAVIAGRKVFNGRELSAGEFSFVLKDSNGNTVGTVTNDSEGRFAFDEITYTSAGVYTYTLSEEKGDDSTVIYDDTVYTVTVTVTDNDGVLSAIVSYGAEEAVFTNSVHTPEVSDPETSVPDESDTSEETPGLGDNASFALWISLITVSVIGLAVLHINRRRFAE